MVSGSDVCSMCVRIKELTSIAAEMGCPAELAEDAQRKVLQHLYHHHFVDLKPYLLTP